MPEPPGDVMRSLGSLAPAMEPGELEGLVHEHRAVTRPGLERLWDYYRNPMAQASAPGSHGKAYHTAQERGLPARLRKPGGSGGSAGGRPARERVIENDIAWRINALVDFVFGKSPIVRSLHADDERGRVIERFLGEVFEQAGGPAFFQTLGLLGSVYGQADVLLRVEKGGEGSRAGAGDDPRAGAGDDPRAGARGLIRGGQTGGGSGGRSGLGRGGQTRLGGAVEFHLDPVEATRGIAVLSRQDYREIEAYLIHTEQPIAARSQAGHFLGRVREKVMGKPSGGGGGGGVIEHTTLFTADRIEDFTARPTAFASRRTLVKSQPNPLGRIPLVHIQNLAQPFMYAGLSDVEPLVPLQDELNTRLSDRANRVTFQSFKMYLGKGIEGFTDKPVGPGQMWSTDNPEASIQSFGGDGDSPSESAHIAEVREAMDKASGVPPVAAGLLGAKVGNLTSQNALHIVLMGMLAKAQKKRTTYGAGLARVCELVLHAADVTGVLPNQPHERKVRWDWPDPLPPTSSQALADAQAKVALGVDRGRVLAELGYE